MMQEKNTTNCKVSDIRPEELIVNIYRDKLELLRKGINPRRIVMPMEMFRKIQMYHAGLGEVQGDFADYITEDEIFGIPVYIDNVQSIRVE